MRYHPPIPGEDCIMATAKALRLPATLPIDEDLMQAASKAAFNAYARYSGFRVGAAVRSARGAIHVGVNVENISYPVGTCAEAGAIAAARAAEGEGFDLVGIAIAAMDADDQPLPCSPCGACRQRITEFSQSAPVMFRAEGGHLICEAAGDLLPHQFGFNLRP